MSLRQDLKSLQIKKRSPYYLVFFKEDRSLGVAKANNIIELDKEDLLEPGTECHVRSKKNVFDGIVVTHGTEIDVDIVGEKIINKLYTPEFLKGLLSDDSDSDDVTTDCTCASDSDIHAKSKRNAKRKRTDSGKPANKSMMKTPLKKTNRKSKTRSNVHEAKDEQKSTINVLAVSQNTSNTSSTVVSNDQDCSNVPNDPDCSNVPNDPDCSPISSAVVPNGPSSPTTCMSSTLSTTITSSTKASDKLIGEILFSDDQELLKSLCTRIDRLESQNSLLFSHITSIFSYLPPNIQQFHQQASFPPFNQPQPPFNPALSIPQDFYSPVTHQQLLAPITQQQSLAPITQQQSLAPITQQQSLAPITQQQSLAPITQQQSLAPINQQQSMDPFTQEQSLAPITQEQSLGPITQELHVLTIPPSITPPPLPPSINSPPLSYSITHTPASTPPLSDELLDPDEVIANYPKLRTISNIDRLAVRLASESYFSKDLLKRSTVYGLKGNASLPGNKVRALKKKLCNLYPRYVDTPAEFEPVWTKCVNTINHHASGLRKKDKDGVTLELN